MAACTKAVDRSYSGTTKLHCLEENIGAAQITLSAADLKGINEAVSNIEVQGARSVNGHKK
jgi:aryl-alcohol dehydrogenase-like predicted oxidoreductase